MVLYPLHVAEDYCTHLSAIFARYLLNSPDCNPNRRLTSHKAAAIAVAPIFARRCAKKGMYVLLSRRRTTAWRRAGREETNSHLTTVLPPDLRAYVFQPRHLRTPRAGRIEKEEQREGERRGMRKNREVQLAARVITIIFPRWSFSGRGTIVSCRRHDRVAADRSCCRVYRKPRRRSREAIPYFCSSPLYAAIRNTSMKQRAVARNCTRVPLAVTHRSERRAIKCI